MTQVTRALGCVSTVVRWTSKRSRHATCAPSLETGTAVKEYLKVPEQLVVSLANLAQAHHPNISTSPALVATVMRPAALSAYLAGSTSGLGNDVVV